MFWGVLCKGVQPRRSCLFFSPLSCFKPCPFFPSDHVALTRPLSPLCQPLQFVNLMYGPWKIDPSEKKKSAMKMICLGEEQKVILL